MEMTLLKSHAGALVPMCEEEADKLRKFKLGSVIRADYKEMRSGPLFRKWFVLVSIAYDLWSDGLEFFEFEGRSVLPNKEKFRKDLTILAGYFYPVYAIDGSMTLEADSIQWSKMDDTKFEKLYQATITAILQKVLASKAISREQIERAVDDVLRFA